MIYFDPYAEGWMDTNDPKFFVCTSIKRKQFKDEFSTREEFYDWYSALITQEKKTPKKPNFFKFYAPRIVGILIIFVICVGVWLFTFGDEWLNALVVLSKVLGWIFGTIGTIIVIGGAVILISKNSFNIFE